MSSAVSSSSPLMLQRIFQKPKMCSSQRPNRVRTARQGSLEAGIAVFAAECEFVSRSVHVCFCLIQWGGGSSSSHHLLAPSDEKRQKAACVSEECYLLQSVSRTSKWLCHGTLLLVLSLSIMVFKVSLQTASSLPTPPALLRSASGL